MEQIERWQGCVAEEAGTILGFSVLLRMRPAMPNWMHFSWRRGIGRALIEEATRKCFLEGAAALFIVANPRAEQFYRACGFENVGERQTQLGRASVMRRISDRLSQQPHCC